MIQLLHFILTVIFALLSLLHYYWALGGRWAIDAVVPTKMTGEKVLKPSNISSFIVGFGLMIFAAYYVLESQLVPLQTPAILSFMGWLIPGIFLFRFFGDFKYIGFFKKIRTTPFGRLDTQFFAPLCLLIAVTGFMIYFS